MKFDVDCVVTLDDNKQYYLIDKNVIDGITYYYASEYTGDEESLFDNEKLFFKENNGSLEDVVDIDLIIKLKELFLNKFVDVIS